MIDDGVEVGRRIDLFKVIYLVKGRMIILNLVFFSFKDNNFFIIFLFYDVFFVEIEYFLK